MSLVNIKARAQHRVVSTNQDERKRHECQCITAVYKYMSEFRFKCVNH